MNTSMSTAITTRGRVARRLFAAGAVAAAATAVVAMTPGAAQAAVGQTYAYRNIYLSASSTNGTLMLDVAGASTSPGAPVIQYWLNGGANQKWDITQLADGNHEVVNVNSRQCLTTDGIAGHGLYQWPCYGGAGQVWSGDFAPSGYTTHSIKNPNSGLRVDIYGDNRYPGGVVDAWYSTGRSNQYFFSFQG